MDSEAKKQYGKKMFAIGANWRAKKNREELDAQRQELKRVRKALEAAKNRERQDRARERRKKWDWKYRVFSVPTVMTIGATIVLLKAIDLLSIYLSQ